MDTKIDGGVGIHSDYRADIESMPGVMAYGETRESAIAAVRALALRAAADCIEHGEEVPAPLARIFSIAAGLSTKARQVLAALLRIGWTIAWQKGSHRRLQPRMAKLYVRICTIVRPSVQTCFHASARERDCSLMTFASLQ